MSLLKKGEILHSCLSEKMMKSSYFYLTMFHFYCILQLFSSSVTFLKQKKTPFVFKGHLPNRTFSSLAGDNLLAPKYNKLLMHL